eukprot:scaffold8.g1566.t1
MLLHIKRGGQEFLLEAAPDTLADEAAARAAGLYNLQARVLRLHAAGQLLLAEATKDAGPSPPTAALLAALDSAAHAVGKEHMSARVPLSAAAVEEALERVRAAMAACEEGALPAGACEALRRVLEGGEPAADELDAAGAALYFAGKVLAAGRPLKEWLGANDKTRALVHLQRMGAGPPPREPQLDAEGERAMLQWWHARQEAQRRAAAAGEAEAASERAAWSDPRALKQAFVGVGDVRLK